MLPSRLPNLPVTLSFLAFVCGCGFDPQTLDSLTEVVNRSSGSGFMQSSGSISGAFSRDGDGSGGPDPTGLEGELATSSPSFTPLYPDRDNPFVYPADANNDAVVPTSTSVAEIQVMGFANVQSHGKSVNGTKASSAMESKVLLKTDLGIKLLAVGEHVGQITVLRIDSPTVELKMGSLIWTATMFDR